jgi:ribonucleoside-diphosphate reductase alpha chain
MAIAPERAEIGIRRHFMTEGVHPYDEVRWERRDARITNFRDGTVAFEQLGVEVPHSWSVNATNILAQKYFRGTLGTDEREWSLKQVADRVVDTLTSWGIKDGYFVDDEEARTFNHELKYLIIHQRAAFNSPVWFNIGVADVPQQGSACFILSVEDTMDSILNWYTEEGIIFKGGSGAGVNLSRIRSSHELLKGGGTASGPVSFMRGADASAGTIKSGGKTRRAAKMVILDADHPDVEDFIWCKAIEERKARVLRDAGFDMDLDGADSHSTQYQNANNSVRVTDEFMEAVIDGRDWNLTARTDGSVVRTVPARDLFRQIAHSAWECADPGLQYDTTINRWHTAPNTGRITGSNPCFPGSAKVHTDKGLIPFRELFERANNGETFGIYTHDATNPEEPAEQMLVTSPEAFMITGFNDIVRLRFDNGAELRCTPSHKIFTTNRGYVEARHLVFTDEVKLLDLEAPAVDADLVLPVSSDPADYWTKGDHDLPLCFPETWSEEFAHYLGWLIGDGSTSGNTVAAIYGSQEDRDEILPRHAELLDGVNCGRPIKLSEQANGTAQLRLARRAFKRFIEALGVKPVKGPEKTVPWSLERAPAEIVAAFLRGLYDADGCVVDSTKNRYVGLGSSSPELLRGVQTLLSAFGIMSRLYQTRGASPDGSFTYTDKEGVTKTYGHSAAYDLRITSESVSRFAQHIGFSLSRKAAKLRSAIVDAPRGAYAARTTAHILERVNDGYELTYNLSEPRNHSYVVNGLVVRNCSEYVHLENSACNLASLNLLKFLDENDEFDVEGFKAAVSVLFTGQEIIVGNADYPTEKIGETTRAFRELGIGYANLGALLMAEGLPYDSDAGRAWAAAITALLTGHGYATSARTAARMGPFAGFHENSEPMLNVLRMHQAETARIDEDVVPPELLSAAQEAWDEAVELAEMYGVRNSQCSVLAPTGTIGLLLDCDTTGVEPDLGLVKTKKLVGGGTMSIVNQTVPRALAKLGYGPDQVDEIVTYVNEHMSIVGAPYLAPEHLAVFACSMGDNTIHHSGHIRMMGAIQPFISGAISKTVNMPEDVTVEDVEQLHIDAWRLGLKAVAIYRDNCKVAQPLSTTKKEATVIEGGDSAPAGSEAEAKDREIATRISELEVALAHERERAAQPVVVGAVRERLPRKRNSKTFSFRVADCEGYVTVGEYEDGRPGEVFIKVSKQGSTLAGIMDAFSIAISLGLQHQVPLATFVTKYANMKFEPAGITDDPELRIASSLADYIFRRLALDYLTQEERADLGILSTQERSQPTLPGVEEMATPSIGLVDNGIGGAVDAATGSRTQPVATSGPVSAASPPAATGGQPVARAEQRDAPYCYNCGNVMQRAGSCYVCGSCGSTSGCS